MDEQSNNISSRLKPLFKEHNYNKRYERLSIVYYMIDGKIEFYQAIKNVPRKTAITDENYWKLVNYASVQGGSGGTPNSEQPTFDNDLIPIYFPSELGGPSPIYYVETFSDDLFNIMIVANYIVPNQTNQPEITGVKINNVSYTLVSPEDDPEPEPGIVGEYSYFMTIDADMYEELLYLKEMGMNIDANIGDGLFYVELGACSDTAPSGPITFELNTNVGNCTAIIPQYVEPNYSYIYVYMPNSEYNVSCSNYYEDTYDGTFIGYMFTETYVGEETTIQISDQVVCTGWQESSDGETWTDIPNSASNELEVTVPEGSYYYKPIVVNAEPNWVEISREEDLTYTPTCYTDFEGHNTGLCLKAYVITYEDQNPYSNSYENTYTDSIYSDNVEDLIACPLPIFTDIPVHVNVWTEYDDNGTTLTNDTSKATVECHIYRSTSDYYYPGVNSVSLPYNDNIAVNLDDTYFYVYVKIHCAQGYKIKGNPEFRNSSSSPFDESSYSENIEDGEYTLSNIFTVQITDSYLDVKVILESGELKELTGHIITEFDNVQQPSQYYSELKVETYDSVYGYFIRDAFDSNRDTCYFWLPSNHTLHLLPKLSNYVDYNDDNNTLANDYEIAKQYIRYSENDTWTEIPITNIIDVNSNITYVDVKIVLRERAIKVRVNALTDISNGTSATLSIDNTSVTLTNAIAYLDGDSQQNVPISLGPSFTNVSGSLFGNTYCVVHIPECTYNTLFTTTYRTIRTLRKLHKKSYISELGDSYIDTPISKYQISTTEYNLDIYMNLYIYGCNLKEYPEPIEFDVNIIVSNY